MGESNINAFQYFSWEVGEGRVMAKEAINGEAVGVIWRRYRSGEKVDKVDPVHKGLKTYLSDKEYELLVHILTKQNMSC